MIRRIAGALLVLALAASAQASYIAYNIPAETSGYSGGGALSLGLEFNVNSDITVTQLGTFLSYSDYRWLTGNFEYYLARSMTVSLYDRNDTALPLATVTFTPDTNLTVWMDPDATQVGSMIFKDLDTPLSLSAGFQGVIVAYSYETSTAWMPYAGSWTPTWTTEDGDGALTFLTDGKYGIGTDFPTYNLGYSGVIAPVTAGTFVYDVPEPATISLLCLGGLGLLIRRKR